MIDRLEHLFFRRILGLLLRCAVVNLQFSGLTLLHLAFDDLFDLLGRIGLTAAKNKPAGGNTDDDHQQASTTKNKQFLDKSTACLWFCIIFSHLSFPS